MAQYMYEAIDEEGAVIKGLDEFRSTEELFEHLLSKGFTLVRYKRRRSLKPKLGATIKRAQLAEFFRNLSLFIKGRVSLKQALEELLASARDNTTRHLLRTLLKGLVDGLLLSEVMKKFPQHFSRILIALVEIGEETGSLDRTLEDAANHLEKIEEITSNTKRALVYPAFVFLSITGAFSFWMIYVLPKMIPLFASLGLKKLPLPTRILLGINTFCHNWWFLLPLSWLLAGFLYYLSRRNEKARHIWDQFWMNFPLIGKVLRTSQLAFFFEYFSLLASGGIHIVRSLELMETSTTHSVLKKGIQTIKHEVELGNAISDAFSKVPIFSPLALRLVKVGEQTGNMPEQLAILARHYMKKVNNMVDMLSKTLEPILILFAGLMFAMIALGLLGPIYDLISKIR